MQTFAFATGLFKTAECQVNYGPGLEEGIWIGDECLSDYDIVRLACAPDGSTISVTFALEQIELEDHTVEEAAVISLEATHPDILEEWAGRRLFLGTTEDGTSELVVFNDQFKLRINWRGKRIASVALALQVRTALSLGIHRLVAYASGRYGADHSGYVVWPCLGYDGLVPPRLWDRLPADKLYELGFDPQTPVLISELIEQGGREVWLFAGQGFTMSFRLDAGRPAITRLLSFLEENEL